jgi:hypothetical protein
MKADKRLPDNHTTSEKSEEPRIEDQPGQPEKCRVYQLYALSCNTAAEEMDIQFGCRNGTLRCGDCKHLLANRIIDILTPIQERRRKLDASGGGEKSSRLKFCTNMACERTQSSPRTYGKSKNSPEFRPTSQSTTQRKLWVVFLDNESLSTMWSFFL